MIAMDEDEAGLDSSGHVAVGAISPQRLALWLGDCERDNATPLVLVAIGHDEQSGTLHVYRTEDGPSDADVAALLRTVAVRMEMESGIYG